MTGEVVPWTPITPPMLPWIRLLDRALAGVDACSRGGIPTFAGRDVWVFSDYSGQQERSAYVVLAALLMDADASSEWPRERAKVRERSLPNGRRMSFKTLNDVHRQRALVPFLNAADLISGMLVTVAIDKRIKYLCGGTSALRAYSNALDLQARWNNATFEHMLRVCHFTSVLVAGATKQVRAIWITDEDEFVANQQRKCDASRVAAGILTAYAPNPRRTVQFGTTELDEDDRGLEDLVALPDLVAGATAEFVTFMGQDTSGTFLGDWPIPPAVSKKTDLIMTWWTQPLACLRRFLWVITPDNQDDVEGIRLRRIVSD
jgi:hypothetical protein